jgi:hypothetical protein
MAVSADLNLALVCYYVVHWLAVDRAYAAGIDGREFATMSVVIHAAQPTSVHKANVTPVSDNVSAVYEVPELTERSAEGFPRPILIDTPSLPAVARPRSGRRVNPAC